MTDGPGGYFDWMQSPWAGAGAAGLGAGGDIWSLLQNILARAQQQKVYQQLMNPQGLMAGFPGMSQAASQAVTRDLGSNWATMTGGAPGGAMNQYIADAMAKLETENLLRYMGLRGNALQGALGAVPGQQPLGALAGVMRNLGVLRQLGMPQGQQGIALGYPSGGGFGSDYSGMSDAIRSMPPEMPALGVGVS